MRRWVLLISLILPVAAQDPPSASQNLDALSLEDLMQLKVQGAAMHPQTLQDAPPV